MIARRQVGGNVRVVFVVHLITTIEVGQIGAIGFHAVNAHSQHRAVGD